MSSTTDTTIDPDTSNLDAEVTPAAEAEPGPATLEANVQFPPALSGAWFARLPRYRFVAPMLRNRRVLEIQCSDGHGTAVIADAGATSVSAVDERPEMIQATRARLGAGSAVELQLGRGSDLEFEDDAFDAVVWLSPEWTADPGALREVRRVLAPGGVFLGLWSNPEAYGLEQVLPGAESRLLRDTSLVDACASLSEHFASVTAARQIPVLQFRFENIEELPVPGVPEDAVESEHLVAGEPTADFAEAVFVCADDADDIDATGVSTVIAMPYFGLAEMLGRVHGQLYRNAEDLSQRNLLLEGQIDDQMALALDLEEEVREQRALAADQAERLAMGAALEGTPVGTDLAMRYARCQADLAQTQQGLIEVTADFSRRVQDLTWSLQERDGYIDHLVGTVRSWEEYATRTADELDARELALSNLGEVYRKATEELSALRAGAEGDTYDVRGEVALVRASLSQGRDPELVAATINEMRRSYDVLVAESGDLRHQLAAAHVGRAEAERLRTQACLDQSEQRKLAVQLAAKVDAQQAELDEFAEGVRAVFEERNQLLREKARLEAELTDARGKVEAKMEASLNIEREMNRRTLRIAELERATMSKNIENTGLERENLALLARKSDGDEEIERLSARVAELEAQLAQARAAPAAASKEEATEVAAQTLPPLTISPEVSDHESAAGDAADSAAGAAAEATDEPEQSAVAEASDSPSYAAMTLAELRATAKAAGLRGYSKLRKAELVATLSAKI